MSAILETPVAKKEETTNKENLFVDNNEFKIALPGLDQIELTLIRHKRKATLTAHTKGIELKIEPLLPYWFGTKNPDTWIMPGEYPLSEILEFICFSVRVDNPTFKEDLLKSLKESFEKTSIWQKKVNSTGKNAQLSSFLLLH